MSGLFRRRTSFIFFCLLALAVFCGFSMLNEGSLIAQDASPDATETTAAPDADSGSSAGSSDSMFSMLTYIIPILGIVGLAFTFWKSSWVTAQPVGTEKMERIAGNITDGAVSYTHLTLPTILLV